VNGFLRYFLFALHSLSFCLYNPMRNNNTPNETRNVRRNHQN
jgi:hypothetical protein